jgi:hypothetical protein
MRFRKLRIAWSLGWGLAAVLLIALWVRSYFAHDALACASGPGHLQIDSGYGGLGISAAKRVKHFDTGWALDSWSLGANIYGNWGFKRWTNMSGSYVIVGCPDWFVILIATTLGVCPWIRWARRFTLRTLLIATALVAVVLGLIVWLR